MGVLRPNKTRGSTMASAKESDLLKYLIRDTSPRCRYEDA
jgi:hypothetical protein